MRALPVCYLERVRESTLFQGVVALSATLHSTALSLSLSLLDSSSNIWQLVLTLITRLVSATLAVSWQMEKCRLYELTQEARATILNFRAGTTAPPPASNMDGLHSRGTCVFFRAITRPTRGQQQPRGWKVSWLCKVVLFSFSLFFFTQNKPSFFLQFFVVFFSAYAAAVLHCCSVAVVLHFCCVQHYLIRTAILFLSLSLSLTLCIYHFFG